MKITRPSPKATDPCTCGPWLKEQYAATGIDVTVSTAPPIVLTPYTIVDGEPVAMTCPHGITWWSEPTSDQIAQWARDGVA